MQDHLLVVAKGNLRTRDLEKVTFKFENGVVERLYVTTLGGKLHHDRTFIHDDWIKTYDNAMEYAIHAAMKLRVEGYEFRP